MSDEDFWKPTAEVLQPLVPTIQMSEKLLSRPPFRFLHDVFSYLSSQHGVMPLSSLPEDLRDGSTIDSKEKKLEYLTLVLGMAEAVIGGPHGVDPKKVVSGKDCEKTNILLQQIAQAIIKSGGGQPAVSSSHHHEKKDKKEKKEKKARRDSVADAPPPPPPPPDVDDVPPPPPPPSDAPFTKKPKLDLQQILEADPDKSASREQLMKRSKDIGERVKAYGFQSEELPGKEISQAIRKMELELKDMDKPENASKIDAGKMPEEALKIAIQRQIDSINQVRNVLDDNNALTGELIEYLMGNMIP